MISAPKRLRTQIALAMGATCLLSLVTFVIGMTAFYLWLQDRWIDGLSEDNQESLRALVDNETLNSEALTTLIGAFSFSWSGRFANLELLALAGLMTVTLLAACIAGVMYSKRLSRPIEALTGAANHLSTGPKNIELEHDKFASVEARELITSFNAMASSLVAAEREAAASAAAIAHELRTPLTVLKGRLQGFRDGTFEPNAASIDALLSQVDTLSNVVSDLATLSGSGADNGLAEFQDVNLATQIEIVLAAVGPDLATEGIKLDLQLEPVLVQGDALRIRQCVTAIIENVRRYAADGEYLRIATFRTEDDLQITFIDKGPGLSSSDRKLAFDRWWRGESSRNRLNGGSGLGLSIVKSIVQKHGGRVDIEDRPTGQGLCVRIRFPTVTD